MPPKKDLDLSQASILPWLKSAQPDFDRDESAVLDFSQDAEQIPHAMTLYRTSSWCSSCAVMHLAGLVQVGKHVPAPVEALTHKHRRKPDNWQQF